MAQRFVVPVDGSDSSWKAVDVARSLAGRVGATVHVIEVVFAAADAAEAEIRLDERMKAVAAKDLEVTSEVRIGAGTVAEAVAEVIAVHPDAVVIMASHGRGRSAALVGSVAEEVLQQTFGPALLVGPRVGDVDFTGPVVASVDGSDESEAALPLAAAWAARLGVDPWVIHVAESDRVAPDADVTDAGYPGGLARDLAKRTGREVEFDELHSAHPGTAVPEYCDSLGASVIVASSHGRSGLSRLTIGSVTAGFVRNATCPVLVIRLPHPEERWQDASANAWAT